MWSCLYTQNQLLMLMEKMSLSLPCPRRGEVLQAKLPEGREHTSIEVSRTNLKSTYGKPLFRVEMR